MLKPFTETVNPSNIPNGLKQQNRWCCWIWALKDGKWTKPPYQAESDPVKFPKASSTNPSTWSSFNTALTCYLTGKYDGIGFIPPIDICGIDIDHCREKGIINEEAQAIINEIDSYTEVSPSGTGVHIYFLATKPGKECKEGIVEIYQGGGGRYLTFTGQAVAGSSSIENRQEQLNKLHARIFKPKEVKYTQHANSKDGRNLEKAKEDSKFLEIWDGGLGGFPSASEGDLWLSGRLAFWSTTSIHRQRR